MTWRRFVSRCFCQAVALSALCAPVQAAPLLESVSPLSCQIGGQVNVKLSGKDLEDVDALVFSIPGLTAKQDADGAFVVSVGKDIEPQDCDIWCLAGGELSNPRRFVISIQPSIAELAGNDTSVMAQRVPFPGAVDGRLEATGSRDWFQFDADAGQLLTISCRSRSLDGSAVPVIAVFDHNGREIAHSSGRRREPLLHFAAPTTGTYRIRVSDRAYRSAVDSFYRLELLAGPQIAAVWPDLVGPKRPAEFQWYGFGLQGNVASDFPLTGIRYAVTTHQSGIAQKRESTGSAWREYFETFPTAISRSESDVAGQARICFADREVLIEDELNTESAQKSQLLTVPVLLNGRFDRRNDIDWFAFDAKKDETFRIDVYGERFGQVMDPDATILDSTGKTLVNFPDAAAPKDTPSELSRASLDVSATWKAPADGRFILVVRDHHGSALFGADRTYALSLRKVEPSFDVVVLPPNAKTPAGYSVPRGGRTAVRVALIRRDGFKDAVRVTLAETSRKDGLQLDETWIGPGASSVLAAVSSSTNESSRRTHFLNLEARSDADDPIVSEVKTITLLRSGASVSRFVDHLPIAISRPLPASIVLSAEQAEVSPGESLVLKVVPEFRGVSLKAGAKIGFPALPAGMKAPEASLMPGKGETTVTIPVPDKLPPGRYTIAAHVAAAVVEDSDSKKEASIAVWSNGLTFHVVPKQPAK